MQTASYQEIYSIIREESGDYLPWLPKGEARGILHYCFVREAFDNAGEDIISVSRKLVLDFCYQYAGCNPTFPFPEDYEIAEEATELQDCWNRKGTYKLYDHCQKPKSDRANRSSGAYITTRVYECCEEPLAWLKDNHAISPSELIRYLVARYACLQLRATPDQ